MPLVLAIWGPTRGDASVRLAARVDPPMPLLSRFLLGVSEALRGKRRRSADSTDRSLEARTRELAELSTHLQNFAEQERSEIAHNLHDELGGLLTAAKMDLSWLQSRLGEPPNERRLAQLGDALDQAMNVKRRVVENLRPSLLDHFGLATALRAYVEASCAQAHLTLDATVAEDVGPVPKHIAIALFRVAQEGVTNIIRHAEAHRMRLQFGADERNYLLKLSDDGRGFKLEGADFRWSHGLTGMRHRVETLHGRFTLHSTPGAGTRIEVEVPRAAA
jgi:signal transduction histidine kinase